MCGSISAFSKTREIPGKPEGKLTFAVMTVRGLPAMFKDCVNMSKVLHAFDCGGQSADLRVYR